MIKLLRKCVGSVRFRVSGGYARRFIYDCVGAGLKLWEITEENGTYLCCVRASAYRECAVMARRCGVRLNIIQKSGLLFVRRRYRHRAGLLVGVLGFAALMVVLSGYIWNIEISGNSQLTDTQILDALKRQGVCVGMPKSQLDVYTVSNRLFTDLDEISWVFLNRRGTTLYVELRERVYKPEMFASNNPANIVAAYTAQILRADVYNGQVMVRPGQVVMEGDLLVSGVWEDREGSWRLVRADARIWAAARVVKQVRVDYRQTRTTVSEECTVRYELGLFGFRIPLYFNRPENAGDQSESLHPLRLFGREMPVYLRRIEYREAQEETVILNDQQAEEQVYAQLAELEREELAGSVIRKKKTAAASDENGLTLTAVYEVEMDIAKEQEITWQQRLP